jgi:hypothetical protein
LKIGEFLGVPYIYLRMKTNILQIIKTKEEKALVNMANAVIGEIKK